MKDRTKKAFAAEMRRMLDEMPLEKIRVNELCERCGERRQLLYYHFQDKYALVAWIYDQEYAATEALSAVQDYKSLVVHMLEQLHNHREFYKKVFADKSQNSIEWYIFQKNLADATQVAKKYLGAKELSDEQLHAIMFHSLGSVGTAIKWLQGHLNATPAELGKWQYETMPTFLRNAFEAHVAELKRTI